eukprot:Awhi_evm1s1459
MNNVLDNIEVNDTTVAIVSSQHSTPPEEKKFALTVYFENHSEPTTFIYPDVNNELLLMPDDDEGTSV